MEDWQINNITKNLPKLQSWTNCNTQLLAILQSENVLGEDDIQAIECEKKANCKAKMLYDILRTRRNAYYILAKAVIETKQTGAAELLLEIPGEKISKLQILFLGNKNSVENLLKPDQIKSLQTWLQRNASLEERLEIHQTILDKDVPLQLLRDTIPEPDPLYIPRFLTCRQVVNPKLFQYQCPDVFVFKNADRVVLRKVISSYGIEYATRQLLQREITVRFILLDIEANWNKICSKVNSPVHLIRYENETEKFLLEETSGDSNILPKYLEHNQKVEGRNLTSRESYTTSDTFGSHNSLYSGSEDASNSEYKKDFGTTEIKKTMHANTLEDDADNVSFSEDMFVKYVLANNVKCIGICDLPGMGKSYLLASLARKINAEYPDRIVAFIQLQNFKTVHNSFTDNPENAQLELLAQLSTSKISQCILLELVKCESVKLELFFDGLDEVQEKNLETLLVFFQTLTKQMSETRIFVTSRPVLQAKLEKALRVIAYDIKPLNTETQLRYMVTNWTQFEPDSDLVKLEAYARFCLNSIDKFLKKNKNNVTGIPLQCKLIADVYSRDAGVYANKNCTIPVELPRNFPGSIFEIYSKFIRRQLGRANCNFACFYKNDARALCTEECQVRNFHVHKALWCVIPFIARKLETVQYVFYKNYDDLSAHQILSPGILRKNKHKPGFEFVHRTFAEYLVAEYFCKGVLLKSNESLTTIQRAFFNNTQILWLNEGFAYFLDCMITEYQKNVNMQLHCTASISPADNEYVYLLTKSIVCDYKGLLELCFRATENHKLNGKSRPVRSFWLCGNSKRSKPLKWENKDGKYKRVWFSEIFAKDLVMKAVACCSATTIDRIYNFFFEVLHIDLDDYVWPPPIEEAIKRADFELVNYFSEKMSLEKHGLLYKCLQGTYFDTFELVEKKLDIVTFLLRKCPSLLTERWTDENNIEYKTLIDAWGIHLELLKFLVQRGCDILVPNRNGYSIVYLASNYMSDKDFFELCRFMCFEGKARDYFLDPANWVTYVSDFTHWVEEHPTKSLFRILCNLELETVFVQNNPFLSTPKVYEKHMEVFHSLIYSAFRQGKLEFANSIFSLDSYTFQPSAYRNVNLHGTSKLNRIIDLREKLFVSSKSHIFAVSSEGQTILHMAARTTDFEFFDAILCMLGELWDETQDIKSLKASVLQVALSRKAAPENLLDLFNWHENKRLETPLHYAVQYLKGLPVETMDMLLSCGNICQTKANEFTLVDINAVNKYGNTALTYAIIGSQRLELVTHLVSRGADWTMKNGNGCNITHICARSGHLDHLKYFVDLGCDVNAVDRNGDTPLLYALTTRQSLEYVKYLVSVGADWSATNDHGSNVANMCASYGLIEHLNYFLELGCDVNGTDRDGDNALQCAAHDCKSSIFVLPTIIQMLIAAGVDKTNKNKQGKTAYDYAVERGHHSEILKLLQ